MNWEAVKGFCRRQNQKFSEQHRGAKQTKDEQVDLQVQQVALFNPHAFRNDVFDLSVLCRVFDDLAELSHGLNPNCGRGVKGLFPDGMPTLSKDLEAGQEKVPSQKRCPACWVVY